VIHSVLLGGFSLASIAIPNRSPLQTFSQIHLNRRWCGSDEGNQREEVSCHLSGNARKVRSADGRLGGTAATVASVAVPQRIARAAPRLFETLLLDMEVRSGSTAPRSLQPPLLIRCSLPLDYAIGLGVDEGLRNARRIRTLLDYRLTRRRTGHFRTSPRSPLKDRPEKHVGTVKRIYEQKMRHYRRAATTRYVAI
jgi:hypothetical protein